MNSVHIFLLLFVIIEVQSEQEYVPTLVWTSREFRGRKNVDYLALKKVKSDLFEAYMMEILENKNPLIVLFLEQDLSTDDFQWKDDDGDNSFPFLSKLAVTSRVDYFRSVESPHRIITELKGKGYKRRELEDGTKFDFNEGDLVMVEFQKIQEGRQETMRKHDEKMKEIHRRLVETGKNWILIYTARNSYSKDILSDLKQVSPWHVEEQFQEKSTRALSLYQDEFTGFTLVTKGSIQLFLPSPKNLVLKNLENYLVATAKDSGDRMDFVIWFLNYSVTFHLNQLKGDWLIREAKLLNENGDTLKLAPSQEDPLPDNKCHIQFTEFQSEGKPVVKVIVSKYKFLYLDLHEEPCKKPYAFYKTFFLILISIVSTVICWNKLLENMNFSRKSEYSARYYADNLLSFSSKIIL